MTERIVAIVGGAKTSRGLADEQPPEVELWGLNNQAEWMPRWDRWFLIDSPDMGGRLVRPGFEWCKTADVPVYMLDKHPDVPTSVRFPIEDILARYGDLYFTSSIAYMIAMAVHENVDEIRLIGINLANHTEYVMQRACAEHWLGVAKGQGIRVWLPDSSPMLKGVQYGIQRMPGLYRQELEVLEHAHKAQVLEASNEYQVATGGLQSWDRAMQVLERLMESFREQAKPEMDQIKTNQQVALGKINALNGALQVIDRMLEQMEGNDEADSARAPGAMRSVRSIEEARDRLRLLGGLDGTKAVEVGVPAGVDGEGPADE